MAGSHAHPRVLVEDSDDDLPALEAILQRLRQPSEAVLQPTRACAAAEPRRDSGKTALRRRRLGKASNDETLLKPWSQGKNSSDEGVAGGREHLNLSEPSALSRPATPPRQRRMQLRARKAKEPPIQSSTTENIMLPTERDAAPEDAVSDTDDSEYRLATSSEDDDGDGDDSDGNDSSAGDIFRRPIPSAKRSITKGASDSFEDEILVRGLSGSPAKGAIATKAGSGARSRGTSRRSPPGLRGERQDRESSRETSRKTRPAKEGRHTTSASISRSADEVLADPLSKLRLNDALEGADDASTTRHKPHQQLPRPATPPSPPTPQRQQTATATADPKPRGLVSPTKKLPRIPMTPHRPSMDAFWDQGLVDEWNMQHSPRKLLFDPDAVRRSPEKKSTAKSSDAAQKKEAKRSFQKAKRDIAESFLSELDQTIAGGKLSELAAPTGGIQIRWTNKLNTTAGRANWKRETLRTKRADGGGEGEVKHRHYASIELAEKVIDDEHRLLNVIAHEFCHLANFMVSGVTGNPHGKEFKAWAARCSNSFADRGIHVTTKHSYDIDFKYIWECTACGTEFKRHSKSIDPQRHRCGSCKSQLKQTKPVPRAGGGAATRSDYQKFMKEQMKVLRRENPGSPQKDIMKLVADRWASAKRATAAAAKGSPGDSSTAEEGRHETATATQASDAAMDRIAAGFINLTLEE